MYPEPLQSGLFSYPPPWAFNVNKVLLGVPARDNPGASILAFNIPQDLEGRGVQVNHLGAGLTVRQTKTLMIPVNLIPSQTENFTTATAGKNQLLEGRDSLGQFHVLILGL